MGDILNINRASKNITENIKFSAERSQSSIKNDLAKIFNIARKKEAG
jgi:hypothetical protein